MKIAILIVIGIMFLVALQLQILGNQAQMQRLDCTNVYTVDGFRKATPFEYYACRGK